ncbi:MAG: AmmeMemoRadiSam system protein B [Candidatus Methanosuratus sp.]|nr:AmmeMemoRadiSam system protein B [Candidatus Methanosuratincola sp.]
MVLRDRHPSVSGSFYEADPDDLESQIKWCFLHKVGPGKLPSMPVSLERKICAVISPHAGYVYSGPVAAHGFLEVSKEPQPETVVLIGPNHTGMGAGVSIWDGGDWLTPLGRVKVDRDLSDAIARSGSAEPDCDAHEYEHSIEVQIPFLQYVFRSPFRIVPICMMLQDFETSRELGEAIASAVNGRHALLVASTDFSHYVPYRSAYERDSLVIAEILGMRPKGVEEVVKREGITMCGPGPVMAVMTASLALGAKGCRKLCYATSGDTSGPKGDVVGYGSFSIEFG